MKRKCKLIMLILDFEDDNDSFGEGPSSQMYKKGNSKKKKSKKKGKKEKGIYPLTLDDKPTDPRESSDTTKIKWELRRRHNMSALPLGDWRKFMSPFFLQLEADKLLMECMEEHHFASNEIRAKVNKMLRKLFAEMTNEDLGPENLTLESLNSITSRTLGKNRLVSLIQNLAGFERIDEKCFNASQIQQQTIIELTGNLKSLAVNNLKRVLILRISRQLKSKYPNLNVRWGVFRGFAEQICTYILGKRGKLASEKHDEDNEDEEEPEDDEDDDILTLADFRFRLDKKAVKMRIKPGGESHLKGIIKALSEEDLKSYLPNYLVPLTRGNGWGAVLSAGGYENIGLAWGLFHEVNGEAIEDNDAFVQHLFPTPNVLPINCRFLVAL